MFFHYFKQIKSKKLKQNKIKRLNNMLEQIEEKLEDYQEEILFRNEKYREKHEEKKEKGKMSERARDMKELLDKTTTGNFMYVFASILLDEEITKDKDENLEYEKHQVIVPTGNDNSHSYTLDNPVIVYNGNKGLKMDGTVGDNLPDKEENFRFATEDEIKGFFKNFDYNNGLDKLLGLVKEL